MLAACGAMLVTPLLWAATVLGYAVCAVLMYGLALHDGEEVVERWPDMFFGGKPVFTIKECLREAKVWRIFATMAAVMWPVAFLALLISLMFAGSHSRPRFRLRYRSLIVEKCRMRRLIGDDAYQRYI